MSTLKNLEGEDSYEASRRFRERYPQVIRTRPIGEGARNAAPSAEVTSELSELEGAPDAGPSRTPEEDRLLRDTRDK